jgi:hypothetical protein
MVAHTPIPMETPESNQTRLSTVKSLRMDGSDCKSAFFHPRGETAASGLLFPFEGSMTFEVRLAKVGLAVVG